MTFKPQAPMKGEIILIPFPYADQPGSKMRPALVLSVIDRKGDVIVAAITSQPGHVNAVSLENHHLREGALPKSSWIRPDKLYTVNCSLIKKSFANLKPEAMANLQHTLCPLIGCV